MMGLDQRIPTLTIDMPEESNGLYGFPRDVKCIALDTGERLWRV